ncbi:MAG: ATP-dependent zinc metalloprotease FtsH [Acidimicrobiales bacterium]
MSTPGSTRRRRGKDGAEPDGAGAEDNQPDNRKRALVLCLLALPLLVVFYGLILYWSNPRTPGEELRIDEFTTLMRQGRIQETEILETDNRMIGTYDGGQFWVAYSGANETIFARLTSALEDAGVPYSVKQQPLKNLVMPVSLLLPALIIIDGLFILFLAFGRGSDGFTAFGRSRGKRLETADAKITFSDVAGVDEAIEELVEIRDYLASPDRFLAMGASVPKGILLTGPPGCGKTLLARGLAGESEVPFFSISGSDFVEIFVGVGAARIRDFFKVAKAAAPCIVFIDELDAVGRGRSTHSMGGTDEREATLNQLLVEMDGFESGSGVVVLAATNRPDILDSALLRPGRFDRRVAVERPDVNGREGILGIHTRGKPLADTVDMAEVAKRTAGFSGADLANVVNEAALLAARRGASIIEQSHFTEAIERLVAGPERKSRILSPQDRHRIAYHEAGHAVVATALPGTDRVGKLSIVARGHGGGFTWWVAEGDQTSITRAQLLDRIAALLGGRAAEELVTGDLSTGAVGDLDSAVLLARRMVTEFGMGDRLGAFSARSLQNASMKDGMMGQAFSERVASEIDAEIQKVLADAGERARSVLVDQRPVLEAVAKALMETETLEGEILDALLLPVGGAEPATARASS